MTVVCRIPSSPLQLGAMYEFYALYKTGVVHNVMEENAAICKKKLTTTLSYCITCCTLGGLFVARLLLAGG